MIKHKIVGVCLVALLVGVAATPAQSSASRAIPSSAPPAQTGQPQELTLTFADMGLNNMTMSGKYGFVSAWIPFQSNWVFTEAITVNIDYIASPLLYRSSGVSVRANKAGVAAFGPVVDGQPHRISFQIPLSFLQNDQNGVFLEFQGFLPQTGEECEPPNNAGQWLTVLQTSDVVMKPGLDVTAPVLEDLPNVILVQNVANQPPPVIFVTPSDPDAVSLTSAAQVAAGLGTGATLKHLPFGAETAASLTGEQKEAANLVVVGLADQQPLLSEIRTGLEKIGEDTSAWVDPASLAADEGLVAVFNSPWNSGHKVLIVSGGGAEGLAKAGQALANRPALKALSGASQVIRHIAPAQEETRPWQTPTTSFAQFGYEDTRVAGTGISENFFFFRRPAGWLLQEDSTITLHMAASPPEVVAGAATPLPQSQSYVEVYVNDVYLDTVHLDSTGGSQPDVTISLPLPVAVLNRGEKDQSPPQVISVRLAVAHPDTVVCNQQSPDRYWTTIYSDSYLSVSHIPDKAMPNLQLLPYPFLNDESTPVAIVLPSQSVKAEIGMGLSLAATLGQYAYNDLAVSMVTADQANRDSLSNANLILLGEKDKNPLVDEFVAADKDANVDIITPSASEGFLHELPSAWNAERTALVIYAPTTNGVANAAQAIYLAAPLLVAPGSIALANDKQSLRVLYLPPALRPSGGAPQATQPSAPTSAATQAVVTPSTGQTPMPVSTQLGGGQGGLDALLAGIGLSLPVAIGILVGVVVVAILAFVLTQRRKLSQPFKPRGASADNPTDSVPPFTGMDNP